MTQAYSAVLEGHGNIFRYDSPDLVQTELTPGHHKYHHRHRFDVFGTGQEIRPAEEVEERDVPSLRQVVEEAETWYWQHREQLETG